MAVKWQRGAWSLHIVSAVAALTVDFKMVMVIAGVMDIDLVCGGSADHRRHSAL